MKKSFIQLFFTAALIACCSIQADAQLIIQPQLASQGVIQQNQLWNFLIINNNEYPINGSVSLSFQEEGGQILFTATSGNLLFQKGVSQFTGSNTGVIHYDYTGLYTGSQSGGLLPIGRFIVCYTLIAKAAGGGGEECVPLTVEPFSPPQLVFPENKSVQATVYPVLNWLPPMPMNMFSNLNYKLIISEMQPGQSPKIAIQRNPLLYVQDRILQTSFIYPSSYVALQQGKSYAWQIIAQNGTTYSQATEVWSFTIKKDTVLAIVDGSSYPHLQRGAGSTLFGEIGKIKFSYENLAGDSKAKINILQNQNGQTRILDSVSVDLKRGMNFIDIDLGTIRGLVQNQEYILELINGWKENWDLRFQYEFPQ